jgi:FMN-dependent dehydrogenase
VNVISPSAIAWAGSEGGPGQVFQAALDWRTVKLIKERHDIPLVLKGIVTAEDAGIAIDHGVECIYVLSHGRRQLDHGRGSLEVLPEIVDAVAGRAKVIGDGSFCRGTDIIKAIAVGADVVGLGRMNVLHWRPGVKPRLSGCLSSSRTKSSGREIARRHHVRGAQSLLPARDRIAHDAGRAERVPGAVAYSSVDDGYGLDLDEPLRQRERRDADEGARRRHLAREEGRSCFADDGSVFGLIVHDVSGDLHDVGVTRTGSGEGQTDIPHRLHCLRSEITGAD